MTLIQFEHILFWLMMVCRKSLLDSSLIQKCTLLGKVMKILFVLQNLRKECIDRSAERKENHSAEFVTAEQKCLTRVQEMCPAMQKKSARIKPAQNTVYNCTAVMRLTGDTLLKLHCRSC